MSTRDIIHAAATASPNSGTNVGDVFYSRVRPGTGTTTNIDIGVNLSTYGGLVITKGLSVSDWSWYDTARGATNELVSNSTGAQTTQATGLTSFNTNGYTIGSLSKMNTNAVSYVDYTFRKLTKFFDIVTYTGTGVARTISHNLTSVPGCIMVKRTDSTSNWMIYHNGMTSAAYYMSFSLSDPETIDTTVWNSTAPTSSVFSVGTNNNVNMVGGTYVAYVFAHNAGGFGALGTDNVISCGSYSGGGSTITLGWEPDIVFTRSRTLAGVPWRMYDTGRGLDSVGGSYLDFTSSSNEIMSDNSIITSTTGFTTGGGITSPGIYIAIRGNRPITTSTSVFKPITRTGTGAGGYSDSFGYKTDLVITKFRSGTATLKGAAWTDRVRGATNELSTSTSSSEAVYSNDVTGFNSLGFTFGNGAGGRVNDASSLYIDLLFRRATGFFDIVEYIGNGSSQNVTHGLGVTPELIIIKCINTTGRWRVYHVATGNAACTFLDGTDAILSPASTWNSTTPTSNYFTVGSITDVNGTGSSYIAYLFATYAGISKIFSYTGNGTSQNIDCGFSTGARFVLIKATSTTGDWLCWDTARGIIAANDPFLQLNAIVAEVTTDDGIDPYAAGFTVNQTATSNINTNGVTYIGLAIA